MSIREQVAYLKGLAEGMELDTDKKEVKLLAGILDVLGGVSYELDALRGEQAALSETLDAVSEDLSDVTEWLSGGEDEDADGEARYAATCPACQETVYFDERVLEDGEVVCPNCGRKLEFDIPDAPEESEEAPAPEE